MMSEPTRLLLVRHGRTTANASGELLGRRDVPLDDLGRLQAAALGAAINSGRFGPVVGVVSSPLRRALETAAAISSDVTIDDRLAELDYGTYEGVPVAEIPAETWATWRSDPEFRPPGGETLAELDVRVREACHTWFDSAGGGTLVLVSHVSPIKAAVSWALAVGPELSWRTHLDNASISQIEGRGGNPVLRTFNEIAHLAG